MAARDRLTSADRAALSDPTIQRAILLAMDAFKLGKFDVAAELSALAVAAAPKSRMVKMLHARIVALLEGPQPRAKPKPRPLH